MHVTWNGLHMSQLLCTAHELFFVRCTRVIICVMHDSKKHASNVLCAAHKAVFLCAACKLKPSFAREGSRHTKKKHPAKCDKMCEHEEMIFCQAFTYPYYRWHFHRTNWMPNTIMAHGLDSTGTNNLTRLVAQCTHVLFHKAQLRDLNWSAGAPFSIVDTTLSLHS